MKNYFLVYFLLSQFLFSMAQSDYIGNLNSIFLDVAVRNLTNERGELIIMENVVGSPYLNDNFENGTVFLSETNETKSYLLRYNIFSDEFEVKIENKNELNSVIKKMGIICKLSNMEFEYHDSFGYLQTLVKGKRNLFLNHKSTYIEAMPGKTPMHQNIPAKFKNKTFFYIEHQNNFTKVPNSKNEFYALFDMNSEKIKEYVKKKSLNISNQQDLIEIIKYSNSLD